MNRKEIISSPEYWINNIQIDLFRTVQEYLENNNISRTEFAESMGFTKGYVSKIMNGDYDHRISKLVKLSLCVNKVPRIDFVDLEEIYKQDEAGNLHTGIKNCDLFDSILKNTPNIRLSDSAEITNTIDIQKNYENLPEEIQNGFIYTPINMDLKNEEKERKQHSFA